MLKFTTRSGAEYLIRDNDGARELHRMGPHSDGVAYDVVPDEQWHAIDHMDDVTVGQRAYFALVAGTYRITSPVLKLEEVDG